jgi:hypothetical protein
LSGVFQLVQWRTPAHGDCPVNPASSPLWQAEAMIGIRQEVLQVAYQKHPERFVRKEPSPQPLPDAVWINPPKEPASDGKLQKIQPAGVSKSLTDSGSSAALHCLRCGSLFVVAS